MLLVRAVEGTHEAGCAFENDDVAMLQIVRFPERVDQGDCKRTVQCFMRKKRPVSREVDACRVERRRICRNEADARPALLGRHVLGREHAEDAPVEVAGSSRCCQAHGATSQGV